MTPIRVLELRSVRGTGGGPEKTILLGAARSDPRRFAVTVCYLRDARDTVFGIDARASALPVDYMEIIERNSFDPSVVRALRQVVRERRIDIVHAHDYKTNALARLVTLTGNVVPLSTVHGWTGHSWRERRVYYPADKRVLSFFPRLIAVSEDIRQELLRHGSKPDAVTTILNGIDHRAFSRDRAREAVVRQSLGLADGDVVLGSVGRLEPQKRFDLLIDVFAQLRPRYPGLKLVIAGDGSLRDALSAQVERLALQRDCLLLGHRNDATDLHHAFDLFVQSSDYEGTPNAVLEAMAMETPVVATDCGGTAQLVRHGIDGLIVPCGDLAVLSSAVEQALADRPASGRYAAAARRRVETDLSFDARMAAVEAIYTELCAGRSSSRADTVPAGT